MQVFSIIQPKLEIYKTIKTFLIKTKEKPPNSKFFSSNRHQPRTIATIFKRSRTLQRRQVATGSLCLQAANCLVLSRTLHRILHHCLQLKTPATSTMHHHAAWIARSEPAVCSSCIPPAVRKEVALLTMCSYTAEYIRPRDKLSKQWPWRKQWPLKR